MLKKDRQNKGVELIRSRMSKKNRQYNGQKIKGQRTNNDLQNTTQKTKDRVTRTKFIQDYLRFYLFLNVHYF
jgi:hypothetical protein